MEYYDLDPSNQKMRVFQHIFNTFGLPNKIVEVGVYVGKTTFQLVSSIAPLRPDLRYYAIDPYSTSLDVKENLEEICQFFTDQLNSFQYKENIIFCRERSVDILNRLYVEQFKPQLIYIDGDHTAGTVLTDLVMSFEILDRGGVIICDDSVSWRYSDARNHADPQMSPRMAVDTFLMCNWNKLKVLEIPSNTQTAFVKL